MKSKNGLRGGSEPIILCGPTASGKTDLAVELAGRLDAEIASTDSGQIYRGLDIGTAKPTRTERKGIPFHLIDIRDPCDSFSAADFIRLADEAIGAIQTRGKRVLIVGGTGLYLKALEKGLFEGPPRSPEIRKELETELEREGVEALHRRLKQVDPEAARQIPAQNRQRIIRALEVHRLTGRPISSYWKGHGFSQTRHVFRKIGLKVSKEELHRRIDERIDRMIKKGLVEEVEGLLKAWKNSCPAFKLIGYREMIDYLSGRLTLDEAITLIKKNTKQYAKRQMTWFRKDSEIQWLDAKEATDRIGLKIS